MKLIEQIRKNSTLKWTCRIIVLLLAFFMLNDGLTRLSISDDTQVLFGLFEIIFVACFLVCLFKRITNKIDKLTIKEEQTENESKNPY